MDIDTSVRNRVKIILVDSIPSEFLDRCIADPNCIFNEHDQDVIRGLCERSLSYRLSDLPTITYTNPSSDKEIYFLNAADFNSSQLLLAMAKFPEAQIILFLTRENEISNKLNPNLTILDTNFDELNIENWRKINAEITQNNNITPPPQTIVLNAEEIIEKFKREINSATI